MLKGIRISSTDVRTQKDLTSVNIQLSDENDMLVGEAILHTMPGMGLEDKFVNLIKFMIKDPTNLP